jgi:leader peptidase (prepilin peptidase) / N-methyltransferase
MIRILGTVFAASLGLAFGSFLNVCLSRWPEGESIVTPRSHCRKCGRVLAWWENVPLVSWIAQRGRCRGCGAWIGWRYLIVEAAVGGLWAIEGWRLASALTSLNAVGIIADPYLDSWYAVVNASSKMGLYWILVALAALDAEHLWLPNWMTLPGIAIGFLLNFVLTALQSLPGFLKQNLILTLERELVAIAAAAGLILLIRWVYWLIRRREGLGLGDAKLMALLAAWLGLPGALLAFGIGVVVGAVLALFVLLIPRPGSDEPGSLLKLPLGTFLCIGGIVSALWGQPIIAAYLRWAGF